MSILGTPISIEKGYQSINSPKNNKLLKSSLSLKRQKEISPPPLSFKK
jgi:hypothetical protein